MYCNNCGKEIPDGSICDCQTTTTMSDDFHVPQQNTYMQPQQYQQQQNYSQQQQQYQPQQNTYLQPQQNYSPQPYNQPPPPYYNPPPQQYYNIQQINHQSNGMATTGFVFALICVFLGWIPFFGWIFWVLGLIFSIVGLAVSGSRGGTGRGLGIAGLILSIIDLFIIIGVMAAIGYALFDFVDWF